MVNQEYSKTIEEAKTNFDLTLAKSFSNLESCNYRYPELRDRLAEIHRNLSSSVLSCQELEGAAAQYPLFSTNLSKNLGRQRKKAIKKETRFIAGFMNRRRRPLIQIDPTSLFYINHQSSEAINTIFHEIAHSVWKSDNNLPKAHGKSEEHKDRVYSVANLCSNHAHLTSFHIKIKELADSIGIQKACINMFTKRGLNSIADNILYPRYLTKEKAKSLCERIYAEADCYLNKTSQNCITKVWTEKKLGAVLDTKEKVSCEPSLTD